jgi:hypothetical protein
LDEDAAGLFPKGANFFSASRRRDASGIRQADVLLRRGIPGTCAGRGDRRASSSDRRKGMITRSRFSLALFAAAALAPASLLAQPNSSSGGPRLYDRITGPELQTILERLGQRLDLVKDSAGDPKLTGGTIQGFKYDVLFYGCDKAAVRRCLSYQYYLGITSLPDATVRVLNEWNLGRRFGAVARRKDGAIEFRMNVNIEGGVSEENFVHWHEWWDVGTKEFKQFVHEN